MDGARVGGVGAPVGGGVSGVGSGVEPLGVSGCDGADVGVVGGAVDGADVRRYGFQSGCAVCSAHKLVP